MPIPALIEWNEAFCVGWSRMDGTHREFVDLINSTHAAADGDLPERLHALHEHLVLHLGDEDRQMRETGYPSAPCHLAEHAAVLTSVLEVRQLVESGRTELGRRLVVELSRWFPEHTAVMDAGLVRFLSVELMGGAPVLIRRK